MTTGGRGGVLRAAAVDLGAGSGRVVAGTVATGSLSVEEVGRFANNPVTDQAGTLRWDLEALWQGIGEGVRTAVLEHGATSLAVDSWAVDYGLVADGGLVAAPVCYRDARTDGVAEAAEARLPADEHFAITGIARLPFNTVFQLLTEDPARLERATMVLLPDLVTWLMTGEIAAERTNASTTALYDVRRGTWSEAVCARLGLPRSLLPPLREPGSVAGRVKPEVLRDWGLPADTDLTVVRAASHDTASAVAAVPLTDRPAVYVSCGTWSLVGQELAKPVLTEEVRHANVTNEVGVDGTIRFLRNVTGLFLLTECLTAWRDQGVAADRDHLLAAAGRLEPDRFLFDPEDDDLVSPGDMPARIAAKAQPVGGGSLRPDSPEEITRCILDSLAHGHARNVERIGRLSGVPPEVVHIVGGGSANTLLCTATAAACGLPVEAGPVEATAIGNLLVQARAAGVLRDGDVGRRQARALVRAATPPVAYTPPEA